MSITQSEIEKLNRTRTAIEGTTYTSTEGNSFLGVAGGRVILNPQAENVVFAPTATITQTNVQGAINSIPQGGWIPLSFVGFMNGINTTFTFNDNVDFLFYNGLLMTKGSDYTLSVNKRIVTMIVKVFAGDKLNGFKNN